MADNYKIKPEEIKEVPLLENLKAIYTRIFNTVKYFFSGNVAQGIHFSGFLLFGAPGNGKTELVKQVVYRLHRKVSGDLYLYLIDGSNIAAKRWGEAENNLVEIFKKRSPNEKAVILLDDIESLFMARSSNISTEWHFSINSILFHQLDNIEPTNTIVCATTNRLDLVDAAIQSRLYCINVPPPSIKSLLDYAEEKLFFISNKVLKDMILAEIEDYLVSKKKMNNSPPSIRDVQKIIVQKCIDHGVWS